MNALCDQQLFQDRPALSKLNQALQHFKWISDDRNLVLIIFSSENVVLA